MNVNSIPHISVTWDGGNYTTTNAVIDTLTSTSFWNAIIIVAVVCVAFTFFWLKKGSTIITDRDGNSRMNEKPAAILPPLKTLIPAGFSLIIATLGSMVIYGSFISTFNSGKDYSFRESVRDQFVSVNVYMQVGDVPSMDQESKTGIVSRTQSGASGRSCEIINFDASATNAHQDYRFAILCDGQPLRINN